MPSYIVISSLYDFTEERWTILHVFREYLKQVAVLVVINQDFKLTKHFDVFFDLEVVGFQSLLQHVIISVWDLKKICSTEL